MVRLMKKDVNKYKPKEVNITKLKEYLKKIKNGNTNTSVNTERI